MMHSNIFIDNKSVSLGARVGKGGEGEVYLIGSDSRFAVKLYTTSDLKAKEAKIRAMVNAKLASQTDLAAFPQSLAFDRSGSFVGFVMNLVMEHRPIHELYAPGSRKQHFPHADYRFLVRAATNFARAVASVHKSGCVIGDINHSGILVSKKATVSLIDADSFQFSSMGSNFLCLVGVPEYTPPELQGGSLSSIVRTQNHDSFGLAIVLFQLLFMGRHPFVGSVRSGEIPPLHENIRNFRYVYTDTKNVGMDQPPGTPSIVDFSPDLSLLFDRAFLQSGVAERPSADVWIRELEKLESSLIQCASNPLHHYPKGASECPWCDMDQELGTLLFVPFVPRIDSLYTGFDPGEQGFNIQSIWAAIEGIAKTIPVELKPQLNNRPTSPSREAIAERSKGPSKNVIFGYLIILCAVVGFLAVPPAFIVWIGLGGWGYVLTREQPKINAQKFIQDYHKAQSRLQTALADWEKRTGFSDYLNALEELKALKSEYLSLREEEAKELSLYRSNRHQRLLHAFLDQFDIQNSGIPGIGAAKQALLSSYGVDTAADLAINKLLSIPGVGQVTANALMSWRSKIEKRFVYQSTENESDRQEIAKIRGRISAKAGILRQKLSAGPVNLKRFAERVVATTRATDSVLNQMQAELDQALSNLNYLGIGIPSNPTAPTKPHYATSRPSTYRSTPSQTSSSRPPASGNPTCPRCGSSMIKRLAKQGRYAGNYFWGCSRYPRCKGLRNI